MSDDAPARHDDLDPALRDILERTNSAPSRPGLYAVSRKDDSLEILRFDGERCFSEFGRLPRGKPTDAEFAGASWYEIGAPPQ